MKNRFIKKIILILNLISILVCACTYGANYIYQNENYAVGPSFENETEVVPIIFDNISTNSQVSTNSQISTNSIIENVKLATTSYFIHDGITYVKGESKGQFSLSGFCACNICGSGTGFTASGKKVRENHTIAADWNVLPKGTVIILENAMGKDGTSYDGVYVVEDRGGGVKNNHIDIYRPTHDLAKLVTYYGRAYGDVYLAEAVNLSTNSNVE